MVKFDRSKNLVVAPQTHNIVIYTQNTTTPNPTPPPTPWPYPQYLTPSTLIHLLPLTPYPLPSTLDPFQFPNWPHYHNLPQYLTLTPKFTPPLIPRNPWYILIFSILSLILVPPIGEHKKMTSKDSKKFSPKKMVE